MPRWLLPTILLSGFAACSRVPPAIGPTPADTVAKPVDPHHGPRRFYTEKSYGSEAQFNPLNEILNEGFDVLSLESANRRIFDRPYSTDAGTVFTSLAHPMESIGRYGWGNFFRAEILPTSLTRTRTSGKWVSNYQLHLLGSGMVSLRLTDWYELHGFPAAAWFGQGTTLVAHLLNEMSENGGQRGLNEDPVPDIFLFDVAGFALWHQHWMQRAFSGRMQLTNWPGQATYDPATRTLENTGQYFILRTPLPLTDSWRFFYVMGMSSTAGLSKSIGGGQALSLGLGLDGIPAIDATDSTPSHSSKVLPKATLYFDRNNSLLWSISVNNYSDANRVAINVYPGVLRIHGFTTGLWTQIPTKGGYRFGIVGNFGLGLGGQHQPDR
ncbi:MAG TPA: hypothetical protein VIV65_11010 [Gemmatimonadaceae bacterium]